MEADRVDEMKTRGTGSNVISRVCSHIRSCLFHWKLELMIWQFEREHKRVFDQRCSKGWHRLTRHSVSVTTHDGVKYATDYLQCSFCDYKFFITPYHKQLYDDMMSDKRWRNKRWKGSVSRGHATGAMESSSSSRRQRAD
jgi:hypothetical protein